MMLSGVVVLLVGAAAVHYLRFDRDRFAGVIVSTVQATKMAQPALGAAWYEERLLRPDTPSANPIYPELDSPDRRGFVYAF
jgi:hypothetical protein